ncbi:MAG: hypothetical protein ABW185_00535 [Sedimenticola sp.]
MPFNSVTMLDAAVVTIMCSLEREDDALHYIQLLNPDVIRNHYFLNLCYEKEKSVKDWDVTEVLKSLMSSLKTESVCLRQYANLTKLLKNECRGTCNTFVTSRKRDAVERRNNAVSLPAFFISDRNKDLMATNENRNNTASRLRIACRILDFIPHPV